MAEDKLKNIEVELEAPADFTSPEILYADLVKSIKKYHPSDNLTMVEKHTSLPGMPIRTRKESPESRTLSIPSA